MMNAADLTGADLPAVGASMDHPDPDPDPQI